MMASIRLIRNALGTALLLLPLCFLPVSADTESVPAEATPAEPNADPAELGGTPAEPEAEPAEPGGTLAEPEADPAEFGGMLAEPEADPAGFGGTPAEPRADPGAWREQVKQSVVEVHISTQGWWGRKEKRISGLAVGEHLVLTDATFVRDSREIAVTYPTNPEPLAAEVHSIHDMHSVALLKVNGLARPVAVFSHEGSGSEPGREISSFGFWEEVPISAQESQGSVGHPAEGAQQQAGNYFSHSAVTGYGGYGGGVFNECGQLVGLNVAARAGHALDMDDVKTPAGAMRALHSTVLTGFLERAGVAASSADAECLTAQARLEQRLQEEQRQREAELEEARRQREEQLQEAQQQKETELEELQRQREADLEEARQQREEQLQEAQRQREAELAELRREKEAELEAIKRQKEAELEATRQQKEAELEEARRREEERLRQQEEERRTVQERMYWLIGASSGAVLLLLFALLRHRRKKKRELAEAQRRVEEIQEDAQRRFSDCLLQGQNQAGQEINVKLSGKALAQEGVVLGRSLARSGGVIDDSSVSREHARLYVADDTLLVEDLNSMNGTAVNGRKIRAGKAESVRSGDTLRIGAVDLRIIFR